MIDLASRLEELSPAKRELLLRQLKKLKGETPRPEIQPRAGQRADFPLSYAQQRLWFLDQLQPGSPAYNLPTVVRLRGALDLGTYRRSLLEIVRRHESLRTRFAFRDGIPIQVIEETPRLEVPVVDLRALPAERRESDLRALVAAELRRPFDLAAGPLLRALVLRTATRDGEEEFILLLLMHHIVSDGWSMTVLARELGALYGAFLAGAPSPLPELPIQYADFAVWQRSWLQGAVLEEQISFWKQTLAGAATLELPTDRPRPPIQGHRGGVERFALPAGLLRDLVGLGKAEGVTLYMILLAGFSALLSRYSGQEDVSIGSPIANRTRAELEPLIGYFANTLVLRTSLAGGPSFLALLARVRAVTLAAYAYQDLPFEKVVEEINPQRDLSRSPLFQALLALQVQASTLDLPGLAVAPSLERGADAETMAKFDLSLWMQESADGVSGSLEFHRDLFDPSTAARLAVHLRALLERGVEAPERPLSELPLLTAAELEQVAEGNATATPFSAHLGAHQLFEAWVDRTPEAVAAVFAGQSLSYRELNRRANRLAHYLRRLGVGAEDRVAFCLERSADLLVAVLAVMKSGGTYVPLDLRHPRERLSYVLSDTRAAVLLTETSVVDRLEGLPPASAAVVLLDQEPAELAAASAENPEPLPAPAERLAYIIYTSGSTGRPKGVQVPHRALVNFLESMARRPGFSAQDTLLAITTLSFDMAVPEVLLPLVTGARLVIAPAAAVGDGAMLAELLASSQSTVLQATPTTWWLLMASGWQGTAGLRGWIGAEAVPREVADQLLDRGVDLWTFYGPTETTVWSTCTRVTRTSGPVPLGEAFANTQIYVLDRALHLVPLGVPGELYIGGGGVTRGYFGQPGLTAERYLPDPFSAMPGARMYRTSDLVRRRPDSVLEFLGRADFQVKIRGFRIELGEIEAALQSQASVERAAVVAHGEEGARRLVAYVVPQGGEASGLSVSDLRESLRRSLPEYMIPSAWVLLDALPLNANGKVDRRALPAPEGGVRPDLGAVYVAPRTALEELLAGIWCEVLRLERVGMQDNFFTLGGHSLLATQVISRVREAFGVELPLRGLFEKPTVAALALEIESLRSGERRFQAPPLKPVAREGDLPLSFAQERLWFLDQLQPGLTAYNVPASVRLVGRLAVGALVEALREIVRRHEALRTVFHLPAGEDEPVQAILPAAAVPLPLVDLSAVPPAPREAEARRLAAAQTRRPFDLARGPLLRAALLRLAGPEGPQGPEHVLLLCLHHIVTDGWSMGVLLREVAALYDAFSSGLPSPLAELPVQYADYAAWQRGWLAGDVLAAQIAYWKGALAGVPPLLDLPTDRPRPAVQTFRGAHRRAVLPAALTEEVRRTARGQGLTSFMVLLAALQALLHRASGQEVVAVGSPTANRGRVELEGLIGFFANTLVLAGDLSGEPGFRSLLARVREASLGAYAHQDLPFEKLVEELAPERNLAHSPLFQVLFVFQGAAAASGASASPPAAGGLALSPLEADMEAAKFDLTLEVEERGKTFGASLEFNTDLFEPATAARLLRGFETLLAGAVADPARPLSTLPLLSRTQEHQLTHEWNDSSAGFPGDTCLYRWFAAQADRTPGTVAVAFEGETLTYGELDARAGRLARRLRGLGVGPEVRVGICVERSLEMMVGLLGILAAGGAYVPLDPSYPADRLAFMLADSQQGLELPVLLTQARLLDTLPVHGARVICLDLPLPEGLDADLPADLRPSNLAYVIYTSGSTGRPKGAMNSHRGIVNRLLWMQEEYGLTADDRVLQKTPISFDVSVWELFWPLMVGARLVIARPGGHQDGAYLAGLIAEQGITTLHFVPSMLQVFLDSPGLDRCASLRRVIASGEALPADLVSRFFARLGGSGAGLYNLYGPTEAAVDVTVWTCERHGRRASVPIGRPIANTRIHLLDRHLATTPLGVPGELHIGGVQVGRGYLNRPELTAERFIPDPFAGVPGARLYKTGDLARHLPDGAVEFLGRLDHQVKIRGFRIELGEIEASLAAHPGVREAVVVARERAAAGALGDWHLVAYVVGREGMELAPEAEELRGFLRSRLPAHMVPWAFVALPALPLNANGKIDRRALPDPERSAWGGAAGIEEPRSEMERTIAAIWRELLRLDPIGIDDNFFDSGGHSLLAVRVYHQLKRVAGREFPLVALFEHTTIRALARYLEAGEAAPASRLRGQDRGARRREAAAGRRRPRPGAIDSGAIEHDHSQELDSP